MDRKTTSYLKICTAFLLFLIALPAPSPATAAGYQAAKEQQSLIIIDGLSAMFDNTQFLNKDWDAAFSYRSYYFGNNKTLGTGSRIGIWLTELAPGRHYPSTQNAQELPGKFKLFKQRENAAQGTGSISLSFGQVDYVTFSSTQVPCAIFTSTFGAKSAHMGTEAGTMRLNGLICLKKGETITTVLLDRVLQAIGVRGISEPKPFAPLTNEPKTTKISPKPNPASIPAVQGSTSVVRLGELKQLLDKGLITEEDYDRKKQEILDSL